MDPKWIRAVCGSRAREGGRARRVDGVRRQQQQAAQAQALAAVSGQGVQLASAAALLQAHCRSPAMLSFCSPRSPNTSTGLLQGGRIGGDT